MSEQHENVPLVDAIPASSCESSDIPFGFYWSMPIVAFAAVAACVAAGWLSPGEGRSAICIGASVVVLLAALIQTVRHRHWERQALGRRQLALELLIQMTSEVGPHMGSEYRTLQRLPESIRVLLGMKMSCVGLLEEGDTVFHIVASSGIDPPMVGRRIARADIPTTSRSVQEKYIVTTPDTEHANLPVNSALAHELKFRSMVHIPMLYQDRVLGVIVLGHDQKRDFSEHDVRRAWLWGCHAAVMLAHSRLYAQMRDSVREQERLMEQRNALYDLNTTIQRPGTLEEILNRIVELAPGTLEVDGALIWLIAEDNPDELSVVAATAPYGAKIAGFRIPTRGSQSEVVLAGRKPVIIEDGPANTLLHPKLRRLVPSGSLMFEPLLCADGRPLGVLVLLRHKTGPFAARQIEIAHMFAGRVAAVIEMARLHQQTLHDSETKAFLLRELNHRVKNNLSAIITLLSVKRPALTDEARRWLDRVIKRIGAMAQAHDLFSVSEDRVSLQELVDRTVRSLSVVQPGSVTVKADVSAVHARLRTERAVKLAMAMHELCFNGITHGLRGQGTLTIRARRQNGLLALEVEDDGGKGRPASVPIEPAGPDGGGRLGLTLVRGLVGRELRGNFQLAPGPGGSIATVEFPLLADELGESPV
jgi:two-component sensor histidine kinase